jgi:hypothetical protein
MNIIKLSIFSTNSISLTQMKLNYFETTSKSRIRRFRPITVYGDK